MDHQAMSLDTSSSLFNDLRLEGEFCDAVIRVQDVHFQVHRIILCECSPYFLALFRNWSTPDQKDFDIPGLSPDIMQLVIDFAYTGCVSVTEDNVQELLQAADYLNVMGIVQTCCNFLGEQLCPKNCIGIFHFTNICFASELQRKAYRYIIDHFEEVVFSEEFLQLSVQELNEIIKRDDLNVRKESAVYEAVLRWIAHKLEDRKGHIAALLSKVRLVLTGMDYIRINVMSNELVMNTTACLPIIQETFETICHIRTNPRPSAYALWNPLVRPRLPNAILLAIGGWSGGHPTNSIEAYDVQADYWINVTNNHERPRAYHGTALINGDLYCVGGFDRMEHFNSVYRFDLSAHTWHEVASMNYRRCYVSVTVLNGCIYAMGGFDGHVRLSTAEFYRPETNQWSLIAPMHDFRSDASCTTLNNKVYICGGFNGNECLQTAECYNPETDQWTMIGIMNCQRSGVGVVAYADQIYAVGGFDGTTRLQSAEAYNPRTNSWHEVASMVTARSNFGIEVLNDHLYVVGGFNGFTTCDNVEYYDTKTDEWSEACNMGILRSALSCCVVSGLPNMAEYVVRRDALPVLTLESAQSGDTI
ncbi:kelch-like protein 10 [Centropristis striata]|uniref:kelch-like protein 10 n=1 Tax=Centropristis striata TaxID=184440 RepID=UPI0027DF3C8C|nr:kelch-like protein 10 [Centropristis striata]